MPKVNENHVIIVLVVIPVAEFDICVASFHEPVSLLLLVRCASALLN